MSSPRSTWFLCSTRKCVYWLRQRNFIVQLYLRLEFSLRWGSQLWSLYGDTSLQHWRWDWTLGADIPVLWRRCVGLWKRLIMGENQLAKLQSRSEFGMSSTSMSLLAFIMYWTLILCFRAKLRKTTTDNILLNTCMPPQGKMFQVKSTWKMVISGREDFPRRIKGYRVWH